MNRAEITLKLKGIIAPYVQNQDAFQKLSEGTDFINDLKINSANLVDIILDIEEQFDIVIDNESMEKMLDMKAAVQIIDEKLAS